MTVATAARPISASGLFFAAMGVLMAITVFSGFAPTYYTRSADLGPLSTVHLVHGAIATAWMLVFIAQAALMGTGRPQWHFRLGVLGAVLAALVVIVSAAATVDAARRGATPIPGVPPHVFLTVPFFDMLMLAAFFGLGLRLRARRPESHKRLMFLGTVLMTAPAFGRLIPIWDQPLLFAAMPHTIWLLPLGFVLAGIIFDLATRRGVSPVYLWGGLAIAAMSPLRFMIAGTPPWEAFAGWLAG